MSPEEEEDAMEMEILLLPVLHDPMTAIERVINKYGGKYNYYVHGEQLFELPEGITADRFYQLMRLEQRTP